MQRALCDGTWRPSPFSVHFLRDPKPRAITCAPFVDRVLHTALVMLAEPLFVASSTARAYACRPGFGTHRAVLALQRLMRGTRFVIHLDVRRYFPSVHLPTLGRLLRQPVPEDEDACRAAAVEAVFSEALRRWFAIIFWFALLGIVGALLYRVADWLASEEHDLTPDQRALITRLQQIMDWPVAQLMTLSLAIATDFDSVFATWKKFHDEQGHGLLEGGNGFLLASARHIVLSGHAARDGYADQIDGPMIGLQQAMDLTWRVLGVWLTVLALLLLVGVVV